MKKIQPELEEVIISGSLKKLPKKCTYDGNPKLKKANVKIQYTHSQVEEIVKCATNINYFAETYVYVIDPNKGRSIIELRDYQKNLLNHLFDNRFTVLMATRQCGKSLSSAIFILHYILFNKDKTAVILANKASIAKEIFQKVRVAYEMLPYWLQVGISEWAKTSCQLENGSKVFSSATTADGIRGIQANLVMLDEYAFIRKNIADEFYTSVYPTISAATDSRIIIVSTPKGFNHFYEIWDKAVKNKNDFKHFKIGWEEVPGRDNVWKEQTIRNIGLVKFQQEFACEFAGSSYTLIHTKYIEMMDTKEPLKLELNGFLKIYELPIPKHIYSMGVDTAKGTGRDYSVSQVLDVTHYPFKQVAMYRNNEILTINYSTEIIKIAKMYNNAFIVCENNDIGESIVNKIWYDIEYENLINFGKKNEIGIRSTSITKRQALYHLRELIQENKLEVLDIDTVYEISKFIELRDGVFTAEEGENDDCVTSLMWASFITKTNYLEHDIGEKPVNIVNQEDLSNDMPIDLVVGGVDNKFGQVEDGESEENWMVA